MQLELKTKRQIKGMYQVTILRVDALVNGKFMMLDGGDFNVRMVEKKEHEGLPTPEELRQKLEDWIHTEQLRGHAYIIRGNGGYRGE